MGLWTDVVGTVRGYIRLGLTGVRLKNSSGTLVVRNAGDSAYANVECGDLYLGPGNKLVFEGTTDDAYETTVDPGDPTADRTLTLPNKSGTVATTDDNALVSGTAVSASGTGINFTGIPSWVKRITVSFSSLSVNGSNNMYVRIGDSGGVESTGYNGSVNNYNGSGVTNLSGSFLMVTANVAAQTIHGIMTLALVDASTNLWAASCVTGRSDAASVYYMGGTKALSGTLDRIQIGANGDTFDSGTVNILYE